jgi:hypothetical protein
VKKPLTALALAAATTVATLAIPAGAAVPRRSPTSTAPCDVEGDPGHVSVWTGHGQLAVENTCKKTWLEIWDNGASNAPESQISYWNVAPGAHFNWKWSYPANYTPSSPSFLRWGVETVGPKTCGVKSSLIFYKGSHGKAVRPHC